MRTLKGYSSILELGLYEVLVTSTLATVDVHQIGPFKEKRLRGAAHKLLCTLLQTGTFDPLNFMNFRKQQPKKKDWFECAR